MPFVETLFLFLGGVSLVVLCVVLFGVLYLVAIYIENNRRA